MAWLPTVTGHTSRVRGKRTLRRFRNLRYSRLGSLRYGAVPGCARAVTLPFDTLVNPPLGL